MILFLLLVNASNTTNLFVQTGDCLPEGLQGWVVLPQGALDCLHSLLSILSCLSYSMTNTAVSQPLHAKYYVKVMLSAYGAKYYDRVNTERLWRKINVSQGGKARAMRKLGCTMSSSCIKPSHVAFCFPKGRERAGQSQLEGMVCGNGPRLPDPEVNMCVWRVCN